MVQKNECLFYTVHPHKIFFHWICGFSFCFQVAFMKKLPTRAFSRVWGKFCDMDLPLWLRKPVIGTFSWYFSCNVAEAVEEEIINYPSLGAFFRRQLKPNTRKICEASSIVSILEATFKSTWVRLSPPTPQKFSKSPISG